MLRPTAAGTSAGRLVFIVCVAFFSLGMALAAMGPLLGDFARQTQSGMVAAGSSLAVRALGSLAGQLSFGFLSRRFGWFAIMRTGMAACIVGTCGLAMSPSLFWLLAASVCLGVGSGVVVLAGNLVAAEASRGAGALNLVNALFGVGAIISPAFVGISMQWTGNGIPALWLVPLAMTACMYMLVAGTLHRSSVHTESAGKTPSETRTAPQVKHSLLRSPTAWSLCALSFIYFSLENCISGWAAIILHDSAAVPLAMGALATAWFWLLSTAARFGAAWASRRIDSHAMLRACTVGCFAGCALLFACSLFRNQALGFAATSLLGLALGPVLPSLLAIVREEFAQDSGVVTGLAVSAGSIGAMLVPLAFGASLVHLGARAGNGMLLVLPLVMAMLLLWLDRRAHLATSEPA